jgi:hypothetical protein
MEVLQHFAVRRIKLSVFGQNEVVNLELKEISDYDAAPIDSVGANCRYDIFRLKRLVIVPV